MRIVIPNETWPGETRVALVPESCKKLIKAGHAIAMERGAGARAFFPDEAYAAAGVAIEDDLPALFGSADLVVHVNAPVSRAGRDELGWVRPGSYLLGALMPLRHHDLVRVLAERRVSAFSTDAIPRTTRAQAMDTLSSMANIAGYRGAVLAAAELDRYFPMLMTAAGMVPPAKVFVVGAAVAGLQAIATARRLGANVVATDVRPEVKEQIESVGAKYVGIELAEAAVAGGGYAKELSAADKERQQQLLADQCALSDVVITTALIRGVVAPRLIARAMVERMRPGAVIVDLAADGGGNCELSRPGETVVVEPGVKIMAPLNVPAGMPFHASLLFSRNLTAFLLAFSKDGAFQLDLGDEIQKGSLITHQGEVVNEAVKDALTR